MVNSYPSYPNASTNGGTATDDGMNRSPKGGFAPRGPFAPVPNTESLAANKTLAITDAWVHFFTPTAARNVTLPATTYVFSFLIFNNASTAGRTLTIKDADANTIGTIDIGQGGLVVCDGTSVKIIGLPTAAAAGAAFTQTYSTADRTVAAATTHAITDNSAGTPSTTAIAALADGSTYANDVAALRNNLATLAAEDALLKADLLALKKNVNAIIDDLQAHGISG